MGPYATAALLTALAVAQVTLAPRAALGGAPPSFMLLAAVCWTVLRGPRAGLAWALAGGLLLDLVSPAPIGAYALPLVAAVAVVAAGRALTNARGPLLTAALVVVATVVALVAQLALIAAAGGNVAWRTREVGALVAPAVAMNLLWLVVLLPPLRRLARRVGGPRLEWGV